MKKVIAAAFAFCMLCSCANQQTKQFTGSIVDASMNNLTVKSTDSAETRTFVTTDADMNQANGLLLGSPVTVDYKTPLGDLTTAVKVVTDSTYAQAVGNWTMPDPIAPDSMRMGVSIMVEGQAASINMATLLYQSWELGGQPDKIILKGQSLGNGQTIDFTEIATISSKDGNMYMAIEGTGVVYEKDSIQ